MLESPVEDHFRDRVIEMGGFSLKADRIDGHRFVDRIAFLPGGRTVIAELKRPKGGRRSALQVYYINRLVATGHEAYFLETKEEVDEALERR